MLSDLETWKNWTCNRTAVSSEVWALLLLCRGGMEQRAQWLAQLYTAKVASWDWHAGSWLWGSTPCLHCVLRSLQPRQAMSWPQSGRFLSPGLWDGAVWGPLDLASQDTAVNLLEVPRTSTQLPHRKKFLPWNLNRQIPNLCQSLLSNKTSPRLFFKDVKAISGS